MLSAEQVFGGAASPFRTIEMVEPRSVSRRFLLKSQGVLSFRKFVIVSLYLGGLPLHGTIGSIVQC